MKIVQYMRAFVNVEGGVVRAVIDLSTALAARGHEVIVLTTNNADAPANWDGKQGRPLMETLPFFRMLPRQISRHSMRLDREALRQAQSAFANADAVHLHVPWDPMCAQLANVARRMNIRYIVSLHGMLDDWTMAHRLVKKRLFLLLGGRRMLQRAATVQSSSKIEAEQSQKWFPRGRSVVVPLIFDLGPFHKLPGPDLARRNLLANRSNQLPIILYVGRLHPIKRIELLLEAAYRLRALDEPFHLIIAGAGDQPYQDQLRDRATSLKLADRVTFAGFVTGQEKSSLYQAATVAVNPSAHESFGLASIEALACGTPVVATRAVNIWPELQSGGGAIITEPNPQSMAASIKSLLTDQARRKQMGAGGREWVFKYLEPDRVAGMYEAMYCGAEE